MAFSSEPGQPNDPLHRLDIDGLRAIAILAVVFFHAFPYELPGGFTGVDIFFVISGFLISNIIFRSLSNGDFRFMDFYARRIRRLFPALIVMLVGCGTLGWLLLLPDEFKQLGKHMAAGAGFVQNFAIWREAGYFDTASELKPLLHLWSLAVEEQFYLLYPVIVWLAWRSRIGVLPVIAICAAISFGLNMANANDETSKAFFVPQTRFWELLAGALLACPSWPTPDRLIQVRNSSIWITKSFFSENRREDLNNLLAASGLLLFLIAFLAIYRTDPFPGWRAGLPVLGTVLLIRAGPQAWVNRHLLSNPVLGFIGLISYPLYLWHWPLLSFLKIVAPEDERVSLRASAVALSFVLAWMTYRWVEVPVRFGPSRRVGTVTLATSIACVGLMGSTVYLADGWPHRQEVIAKVVFRGDTGHLDFHEYGARHFHACKPDSIAQAALRWGNFVRCQQSRPDGAIDIALLGDSHAEHLFFGLAEALPNRNVAFYIKDGPAFVSNTDFANIYKEVLASKAIKTVILSMFWERRAGQLPQGSNLEKELLASARALLEAGKEVYITNDVPRFPFQPSNCRIQRVLSTHRTCSIANPGQEVNTNNPGKMLRVILQKEKRIRMIDTYSHFCDGTVCKMTTDVRLLYRDNNHLNIEGSKYLGQLIARDHPGL